MNQEEYEVFGCLSPLPTKLLKVILNKFFELLISSLYSPPPGTIFALEPSGQLPNPRHMKRQFRQKFERPKWANLIRKTQNKIQYYGHSQEEF